MPWYPDSIRPPLHLNAGSLSHSHIKKITDFRFPLLLHLQVGTEDNLVHSDWPDGTDFDRACENLRHTSGLFAGDLLKVQLFLFVRREHRLLRLLELLKWSLPSIDKLLLRIPPNSTIESNKFRRILDLYVESKLKEATISAFLLSPLSDTHLFRTVTYLTLENTCVHFGTLLQVMAHSVSNLSYLDLSSMTFGEFNTLPLSLQLEDGEVAVPLMSLRSLRTAIALLKHFTLCKNIQVLGLKVPLFHNNSLSAGGLLQVCAGAFKRLTHLETRADDVSLYYSWNFARN